MGLSVNTAPLSFSLNDCGESVPQNRAKRRISGLLVHGRPLSEFGFVCFAQSCAIPDRPDIVFLSHNSLSAVVIARFSRQHSRFFRLYHAFSSPASAFQPSSRTHTETDSDMTVCFLSHWGGLFDYSWMAHKKAA
jgi:hypothetical protein